MRVGPTMYLYDEIDQRLVDERVRQFRDQTRRFLEGKLSEDEFRPLRLRNGLYIQRYAPMLRISIPYGLLSSRHLRKFAHIVRRYDRGYGHFTKIGRASCRERVEIPAGRGCLKALRDAR